MRTLLQNISTTAVAAQLAAKDSTRSESAFRASAKDTSVATASSRREVEREVLIN
jgi:hypothetical protein